MVPRERVCEKITVMSKVILTVLTVFAFAGCQPEPPSEAWKRAEESTAREAWMWTNGMAWPADSISPEIAMTPGMQITARTEKGEITIRAGDGLERFYTWDGATRSAKLQPRKERWYGSLGITSSEPVPWRRWKSNKGITRLLLEEGVLWFKTVDDALAWIKRARSTGADYVYTSNGLVVGWGKILPRKQLNVDVWQFMIDGNKPQSMQGSQNELISVTMP
jgi:hypothetical protein